MPISFQNIIQTKVYYALSLRRQLFRTSEPHLLRFRNTNMLYLKYFSSKSSANGFFYFHMYVLISIFFISSINIMNVKL